MPSKIWALRSDIPRPLDRAEAFMWWEKDGKKPTPDVEVPLRPESKPPPADSAENPVKDHTIKVVTPMPINTTKSTVLGPTIVLHGELTANEDLLVEGQFDGSIKVNGHCLTVGAGGQVKAEIHARQVIVHGKVTGNVSAQEKVEIRNTGHVLGDLTTAGISIEDGAYFKGSIEILREENQATARAATVTSGGRDGSSLG